MEVILPPTINQFVPMQKVIRVTFLSPTVFMDVYVVGVNEVVFVEVVAVT